MDDVVHFCFVVGDDFDSFSGSCVNTYMLSVT